MDAEARRRASGSGKMSGVRKELAREWFKSGQGSALPCREVATLACLGAWVPFDGGWVGQGVTVKCRAWAEGVKTRTLISKARKKAPVTRSMGLGKGKVGKVCKVR